MDQKTRQIYRNLPQKTREIIASPELHNTIVDVAKERQLEPSKIDLLSKVVVSILMGTENKENLKNLLISSGISTQDSESVGQTISNKILNNLDNLYTQIISKTEAEDEEQLKIEPRPGTTKETEVKSETTNTIRIIEKPSKVGDSFTQAIVNQAKAMQPIGQAPTNLPTEEHAQKETSYKLGTDPYREPIE
jgi:hypothetical protein